MSFDELAIKSKWYEIPLGSDCEQEQRGRLQFRGGSRSVSEKDNPAEDKDQEDQDSATKRPDDSSYAYKLGMMFVNGAAKVVNNVADGGKQHRDTIKQLRADLDDSMLNCDKLKLDVGNAKLWIAYHESQNGFLVNQMEESNQKISLERESMLEKLMQSEEDAECTRKELAEVTRMKDALELKVEEMKKTLACMNNQVEAIELPEAGWILTRELSEKLESKEAQLQDATRALMKSEEDAECSRKALDKVTKMKDALELDVEETKETVMRMKNQIEAAKTKISKYQEHQEHLVSSKPVHLTTTSTQVENIESSILTRELSEELKNKEAQLEDATRTLRKLTKCEEDAGCSRKALAEVTRMKDALELKAEETKETVTCMKNQIEETLKKILQHHDNVASSKPTLQLTTTSTQVESAEVPDESSILIRELSQKLKDTEVQLQDARRALSISVSHGEKLRDHLLMTSKSMKSQTIEMKRCSTALESAMNESCTLKAQLEEESQKRKDVQEELAEQQKMREDQKRLHDINQSDWHTHDAYAKLDWRCGEQEWIIQKLQKENIEFRKYFDNYSSYDAASSHQYHHSSNWSATQHQQQSYYSYDQSNTTAQERKTNSTDMGIIQQSDERASTPPSANAYIQNLSSSLPDTNQQEQATSIQQMPATVQVDFSLGDALANYQDNNKNYNEVLAREDAPSWKGEVSFLQDGGYSSSCNYNLDETQSHPIPIDDVDERHYYVLYKDTEFDMVALSLSQIRNVASASGAIATQAEMNDFYDFLAQKIEEMDKDPQWSGVHKLGSPSAWLEFKQEE